MKKVVKLSPSKLRKIILESIKIDENAVAFKADLRKELKNIIVNYLNDLYDPDNSQHEGYGPIIWNEQAQIIAKSILPDVLDHVADAESKMLKGDFVVEAS